MEFVVSNKNYEELNTIRIGIIESYLKTKVEYSTYDRLGTDTQLISIDVDEDIKPEEQKIIMNLMTLMLVMMMMMMVMNMIMTRVGLVTRSW